MGFSVNFRIFRLELDEFQESKRPGWQQGISDQTGHLASSCFPNSNIPTFFSPVWSWSIHPVSRLFAPNCSIFP